MRFAVVDRWNVPADWLVQPVDRWVVQRFLQVVVLWLFVSFAA